MDKFKNIILYFGSFNPVHLGHIEIAKNCLEVSKADQFWFIVSPQNPFKQDLDLAPQELRAQWLETSLKEHPMFKVERIEFDLPKPSYTINSLEKLGLKYPKTQFSILMGEDNIYQLDKWKDYQKIIEQYSFYIYPRQNDGAFDNLKFDTSLNNLRFTRLNFPLLDISSTNIRQRITKGLSIWELIPASIEKEVIQYYKEKEKA